MHIRTSATVAVSVLSALTLGVTYYIPAVRSVETTKRVFAAELPPMPDQAEPPSTTPEVYTGSFQYTSVSAMLAAEHIVVYPEDKVFAFPPPEYGLGSTEIKVFRARPVSYTVGTTAPVFRRTWTTTVKQLLGSEHIDIGDKDIITSDRQKLTESNSDIRERRRAGGQINPTQFWVVQIHPVIGFRQDQTFHSLYSIQEQSLLLLGSKQYSPPYLHDQTLWLPVKV